MSLYQRYLNYLNQGMPDISGIFSNIQQDQEEDNTGDSLVDPILPGVTPQLLELTGGGGDNFSVYNPDPTRTRTSDQYSPFNARRYYARPDSDVGIPSGILSDSKFLYGDQVQLPGVLGVAQDFIESVMPVNKRAILENEALGSGIRLDDIGRVVAGPGSINTAENIMAGYNLNKVTPETIQKRRDMINAKMKDPAQKAAKLKALDEFESMMFGTGGITDLSEGIYNQKSKIKDPTYQTLEEKIALGLAEGDDDDDDYNFEDYIASINPYGIPTGITSSYPGVGLKNRRDIIQDIGEENIKKSINKAKIEQGIQPQNIPATPGFDVSGGAGGSYDRGRDYSGASDRTAGDRARTRDARKSDLGFSDIRLKENVELIGKSPSNINIYKFNYKDNPTTYQGVIAHEVPWANVKHNNGYMMVDYNKVDVEFKKWQR